MSVQAHYPLNTPFKPAAALKTSFAVNFLGMVLLIAGCMIIPVLFGTGMDFLIIAAFGAGIIILVVVFFIWLSLYYDRMWYELREDEMSWKRGVWFHTMGIVPYNRITNLDIKQGPVMRALGISTLALQTAGYSGQAVPEIRIEGMEHAEELRETLRSLVRHTSALGDGTGGVQTAPASTDQKIFEELVKIRLVLEQQKK
jgi:membrane protein YdbS with pleckstrin-like domain